jgi:hypothetical protein
MNRIEIAAEQSTELMPLRGPEGIVPIACTPWLAIAAGAAFGWYLANTKKGIEDSHETGFAADGTDMAVGDLLRLRRDSISG